MALGRIAKQRSGHQGADIVATGRTSTDRRRQPAPADAGPAKGSTSGLDPPDGSRRRGAAPGTPASTPGRNDALTPPGGRSVRWHARHRRDQCQGGTHADRGQAGDGRRAASRHSRRAPDVHRRPSTAASRSRISPTSGARCARRTSLPRRQEPPDADRRRRHDGRGALAAARGPDGDRARWQRRGGTAKALLDAVRPYRRIAKIKGGVLGGRRIDADGVTRLATLPPRGRAARPARRRIVVARWPRWPACCRRTCATSARRLQQLADQKAAAAG